MSTDRLDPVVLGHNPFFGVNHLSRQRGAQSEAAFSEVGSITTMLRVAADHNVNAMMMSTHPRAGLVAEAVRADRALVGRFHFYPLLPYITKYVRQANEKGIVNVVLDQLKQGGWASRLSVAARGGLAMLTRDHEAMLATLIGLELAPLRGLNIQAVFLHDVLTDLALALDIPSVLELHMSEIQQRFGARGGFATKNLPLLIERFKRYGFERPLVLASVNKLGFGMNPSQQACEHSLSKSDLQVMAMGTMASGYLKPDEAFDYVFGVPRVQSVVVGVSSPMQAAETFRAAVSRSTTVAG
jgi:hypothetical protein